MNRAGIIKICGLTNEGDVAAAARLRVDLAGFLFAPSPRRLDPARAAELIAALPEGGPEPVGVFVNESPERVAEIVAQCGLAWIQLHGEEPPGFAHGIPARVIRAARVGPGRDWNDIVADPADLVLLDSYVPGEAGGTGKTFAWDAIDPRMADRGFLLAGGLGPDNVAEAIRIARPAGVDVSSGVERAPGRKDHTKMEQFVRRARRAWEECTDAAK
ncbi:MAG: phosphoribosylanthranilate isomerase [Gemmatimonadetes bacterium]|nr:phosphoribosylanthranilate isomerase [Gemmatimonadota bacterium]